MSYQHERDHFIARMTTEGLGLDVIEQLLYSATTLHRLAELACSSEEADRDRIPCPASAITLKRHARKPTGPCICDRPMHVLTDEDCANARPGANDHHDIPRIRLQDWRTAQRVKRSMPAGWAIVTQGDPRGYVLRVIPPSYAERNQGRDPYNLDAIGVPSRDSRLRF